MAAPTAQINTRMDPSLKLGGDRVFDRLGLTTSEVIRSLWDYAATHQTAPAFVIDYAKRSARGNSGQNGSGQGETPTELARASRGLALSIAKRRCGFPEAASKPARESSDSMATGSESYDELMDQLYDEMLDQMYGANQTHAHQTHADQRHGKNQPHGESPHAAEEAPDDAPREGSEQPCR